MICRRRKKRACADELHVFDENVRFVFANSGFKSGRFVLADDYDEAFNVLRA